MDYTFTIDLEKLAAKSHYLQHLLVALPGEKLRNILVSPPEELIRRLKWMGTDSPDS